MVHAMSTEKKRSKVPFVVLIGGIVSLAIGIWLHTPSYFRGSVVQPYQDVMLGVLLIVLGLIGLGAPGILKRVVTRKSAAEMDLKKK
jgi:hypothetical protein